MLTSAFRLTALAALLACAAAPAAADAATSADSSADAAPVQEGAERHYQECVTRAEQNPEEAVTLATRWRDTGGGIPAKHCLGLALFNAGKARNAAVAFAQAAADLESGKSQLLGGPIRATPGTIAALYGQAGNAALVADDPASAYQHFSRALGFVSGTPGPQRGNLLIDRARALAGLKDFKLAKADLDKAVGDLPDSVDAWLLRAAARRQLGDLTGARSDAEKAARLAPSEPDVLLERATLAAMAGDIAAARADWQTILKLAPGSDAAALARTNLDQAPPEAGAPAAPAKQRAKQSAK